MMVKILVASRDGGRASPSPSRKVSQATKTDFTDASYAVRAVEDLAALFGKAPRCYAYDRGGDSKENAKRLVEGTAPVHRR